MIIALAGRRVDPLNTPEPRFPLSNVELVRERLRAMLKEHAATALVSSAACGADLIALSEAGALGIDRRVILPFESERFRETSVVDRPGDWGPLYDRIIREVALAQDLEVVEKHPCEEAYSAANEMILDRAMFLSEQLHQPAKAVLVWDGILRADRDMTQEFGAEARRRGLPVIEIKTL